MVDLTACRGTRAGGGLAGRWAGGRTVARSARAVAILERCAARLRCRHVPARSTRCAPRPRGSASPSCVLRPCRLGAASAEAAEAEPSSDSNQPLACVVGLILS